MLVAGLSSIAVPATAVGCAFCQYAFEQWAQSQNMFFSGHSTMTNVLFGMLVVVAVVGKASRFDLRLRTYPAVGWAVLGLFAFALVSVIWSISVPDSLAVWKDEGPYVFLFMIVCPLAVSSSRDWNAAMMAMLTLGSLTTCLLLALSSFDGRQIALQGIVYFQGVGATGGNPLAIASLAGWVCLIGLLMNFRGVARFWQVVRWGVVAAALILTFRSGSRGQLFALLGAGVVFLPLSRRIKSIPGFIGAVVGACVLLALASFAFEHYADLKRWDVDRMVADYDKGRLDQAWIVIQAWLSSGMMRWPIGLGNSASFAPSLLGMYPHFVPGEILAEEGFIGFGLYLLVLFLAVRAFRRAYAIVWTDPAARGRLAVLGSLCLFEFVLSLKQGSLLGNMNFFAFVIILGRYEAALSREHAAVALLDEGAYADADRPWEPAGMEGSEMAV
jgi:hypothetical protein